MHVFIFLLFTGTMPGNFNSETKTQTADSLYFLGCYQDALPLYENILEKVDDPDVKFKIAVCNYYQNHTYLSLKFFRELKSASFPLNVYIDYFICLIAMRIETQENMINQTNDFISSYQNHFLCDSLQLRVADYLYRNEEYKEAYPYYEALLKRKIKGDERIHTMKQMALIKFYTNSQREGMERMYQILKRYPSSDDALSIAKYMNYLHPEDDTFFFAVVDVFLRHRYLSVAKLKLEQYIGLGKRKAMIEKARYYLIRNYYLEENYTSALYGFSNILTDLQNKSLEARIKLDIARCYLQLDRKQEAIDAYRDYAENYSRRRIAPEALWKAAWIYEELGDINRALVLYKLLREKWPRSQFVYEAKFREGFSYYRLGNYSDALSVFDDIRQSVWSDLHKDRAAFWISKIYEKTGLKEQSFIQQIELGKKLLSTYYSAKCYWMHQTYLDSILHVGDRLSAGNVLFSHNNAYEQYFRPIHVKQILGNAYALQEMEMLEIKPETFSQWIELADVYGSMEAYHRVFRIYDYIDSKYFSDDNPLDKPELLKAIYPRWYTSIIDKYCRERSLEDNIILAIIRQESIFNREAKSSADAYGLMQIIPSTARSLAKTLSLEFQIPGILFQADFNINLGTLYVRQLMEQYNDQKEMMLAAYNAGPHRVQRWQQLPASEDIDSFVENIEFFQTRNYVRYVMRNYWAYQMLSRYR